MNNVSQTIGNHCASEATSFGWNIQAVHTGHLKEDNEENVVITRKKKKSQNFWNVKITIFSLKILGITTA